MYSGISNRTRKTTSQKLFRYCPIAAPSVIKQFNMGNFPWHFLFHIHESLYAYFWCGILVQNIKSRGHSSYLIRQKMKIKDTYFGLLSVWAVWTIRLSQMYFRTSSWQNMMASIAFFGGKASCLHKNTTVTLVWNWHHIIFDSLNLHTQLHMILRVQGLQCHCVTHVLAHHTSRYFLFHNLLLNLHCPQFHEEVQQLH